MCALGEIIFEWIAVPKCIVHACQSIFIFSFKSAVSTCFEFGLLEQDIFQLKANKCETSVRFLCLHICIYIAMLTAHISYAFHSKILYDLCVSVQCQHCHNITGNTSCGEIYKAHCHHQRPAEMQMTIASRQFFLNRRIDLLFAHITTVGVAYILVRE